MSDSPGDGSLDQPAGQQGIAPYTPSPSMPYGIATSPEWRGKNAPMWVWVGIRLGSPFGELSPQVTERV